LGVNGKKIEVFPNLVDCRKYTPGRSIFKEKNKIRFAYLFLGRISRQKNPDILVESFLKIKPPSEQKLIIVGAGDRGSIYADLLKNYKSHPQIIFTGPKKDINEKVDIIRAADVFVLPSLFEGMSFALLESMACGLAPIVSDAGNHAEVVGNSGIVIENDKVKDQLPIALQVFAKNPDLAKTLGRKAREKVLKNYNQAAQINKLIKIYQEVINQKKTQKTKVNFLTSFLTILHKNF
jgi:glycosyltransferase involved in cell wall biosynthesis